MGRHAKYPEIEYGRQKAYLKTEKGKTALKKYQSSERGKEKKREWWQKNRSTTPLDRQQYFIDTYGNPEKLFHLLNEQEKEVIASHYGLDGEKAITLTNIATKWGKSRQWISKIKKSALNKLISQDPSISNTST